MRNLAFLFLILITGCTTGSHKVTGQLRPAISQDDVQVYYSMPPYAKIIGSIHADSYNGVTLQQASGYALEQLKTEAAKLGANGIVLNTLDQKALEGANLDGKAIFVSREEWP